MSQTFKTLISVDELAERIDQCVVVDCRHELTDPKAGLAAYQQSHIPGAHFLHMDDDLASHGGSGGGRHPLPGPDTFAAKLASIGLRENQQLVAYDGAGGAQAARLWWLARWVGHEHVSLLDGGLPAWQAAGFPVNAQVPQPAAGAINAKTDQAPRVSVDDLVTNLLSHEFQVVDARAAQRFNGEQEPMDPVAGHIPGAINRPLQQNLREDGRFKPAPVIRQEFEALLDGRDPTTIVHSCGSGVTACHNLLAMEYAGLHGSRLYPGSWSEWCSDPDRPVGTA